MRIIFTLFSTSYYCYLLDWIYTVTLELPVISLVTYIIPYQYTLDYLYPYFTYLCIYISYLGPFIEGIRYLHIRLTYDI